MAFKKVFVKSQKGRKGKKGGKRKKSKKRSKNPLKKLIKDVIYKKKPQKWIRL